MTQDLAELTSLGKVLQVCPWLLPEGGQGSAGSRPGLLQAPTAYEERTKVEKERDGKEEARQGRWTAGGQQVDSGKGRTSQGLHQDAPLLPLLPTQGWAHPHFPAQKTEHRRHWPEVTWLFQGRAYDSKVHLLRCHSLCLASLWTEFVNPNHSLGHLSPSTLLLGWALLPEGHTLDLLWKSLS